MKNLKKETNDTGNSEVKFHSIADLLAYLALMEDRHEQDVQEPVKTKAKPKVKPEPKESNKRKVVIIKNDDALVFLREMGHNLNKNSIVPEHVYRDLTESMFNLCFAKVDYETVKSTHVDPEAIETNTFTLSNEHQSATVTVTKEDFDALITWLAEVRLD